MAKKKISKSSKKSSRSLSKKSPTLFWLLPLAIIIILISIFANNKKSSYDTKSLTIESAKSIPTTKSAPTNIYNKTHIVFDNSDENDSGQNNLDEYIQYTIPEGITSSLTSTDYQQPINGSYIDIKGFENNSSISEQEIVKHFSTYVVGDVKKIVINGDDVYTWNESYETINRRYLLTTKNYYILITLNSWNIPSQKRDTTLTEKLIETIKLR